MNTHLIVTTLSKKQIWFPKIKFVCSQHKEIKVMNKQQTAVEWLELELSKLDYNKMSNDLYLFYMAQMFEQAKEMEKNQIMDAYGDEQSHLQDDGSWKRTTAEQYYNETYGE